VLQQNLLKGGSAHARFEKVVAGIPAKLRRQKPAGLPHSPWMLLEHMRLAQWDILEFSRNRRHVSPDWPKGYWPRSEAPPDAAAWSTSIKKLRRDLGIAEALGTNNAQTSIHFAFADSVHQAALFTRCFGDCAEANDVTSGAIWGSRGWLDVQEQEVRICNFAAQFPFANLSTTQGEKDLASIDGMNVFAASVILCQKPLQDFMDMAAELRALEFGTLIGQERIVSIVDPKHHPMLTIT